MTPYFIAEVSSNHNRDLRRCLAFIDKAVEIGCDAVKFQLFKIRKLFAPEILAQSEDHRQREQWELPIEFLSELAARCETNGIAFSCTPFYLQAVKELQPYVAFYKIASYELLWDDLLRACAWTGKPIVLSTGMATLDEIRHAVETVVQARPPGSFESPSTLNLEPLTILHCVSGYPTPPEDCNLAAIKTIRTQVSSLIPHPFSVGWSDHSVRPEVIERVVNRWGAEMIEFHLDLDGKGEEYEAGHCWLPDQIAPVIKAVKSGAPEQLRVRRSAQDEGGTRNAGLLGQMDGTGVKAPSPSEEADRDWRADPSDGLRPLLGVREEWSRR